jgi:membrane-associated phospholipid phosphatase
VPWLGSPRAGIPRQTDVLRSGSARRSPWPKLDRLDRALIAVVDRTPTSLDRPLAMISHAANYSRISIAGAAGLALAGGPAGRCAAGRGLASVLATSAIANLASKPLLRRRRPTRRRKPAVGNLVRMPASASFPSGHSAAAFAFATGAGHKLSWTRVPLMVLAAVVAYSRVQTGVHYPTDVIGGSLLGIAVAELTNRALDEVAAPVASPAPQR